MYNNTLYKYFFKDFSDFKCNCINSIIAKYFCGNIEKEKVSNIRVF